MGLGWCGTCHTRPRPGPPLHMISLSHNHTFFFIHVSFLGVFCFLKNKAHASCKNITLQLIIQNIVFVSMFQDNTMSPKGCMYLGQLPIQYRVYSLPTCSQIFHISSIFHDPLQLCWWFCSQDARHSISMPLLFFLIGIQYYSLIIALRH